MQELVGQLQELWRSAVAIWLSGGWAMVAIAVNAFVMFAVGMHVHLKLRGKGFQSMSDKKRRIWLENSERRKGAIGRVMDLTAASDSLKKVSVIFDHLRHTEIKPFERDLKVMKVCVGAAPLLGLLGTVTGMLATFAALAGGAGGEETMGLVAKGISEALITTETGLVIAIPGLFFQYHLARQHDRYKTFLVHLETVTTQRIYKETHNQKEERGEK